MILSQLLQRIERLEPEASASHQARMLLWLVLTRREARVRMRMKLA